jgi:hypothetical protein
MDIGYYRHIPSTMYQLFELTYRRTCKEHNKILCTEELAKHGIIIKWNNLFKDYQQKKRRCDVNRRISGVIGSIEKICMRFASNALVDRESESEIAGDLDKSRQEDSEKDE